jgi:integrase
MSARNVNGLMEKMADTPAAANNLLKRLRTLFDYSILLGMRKDNPAKAVRSVKAKGDGFHEWTEAEIAKFEAKHALGTKARVALEIFVCTAQRRSDAATMGEDPDKPGYVKVRQLKTDALLSIRIHRDLKAAVAACPSGKATFLVSERGTPYTKESLGNWFKKQCVEAGLPHCSAHGLRKAASRRMAELGLSNQLIKSITGHTTDSEVARYTKNADQARRADKAMGEMERVWRTRFGAPFRKPLKMRDNLEVVARPEGGLSFWDLRAAIAASNTTTTISSGLGAAPASGSSFASRSSLKSTASTVRQHDRPPPSEG